ncbi:hypothetical protein LP419_17590 [Massilia sp. H-1]|nr:hypothetical protein LP419_17590 [Massilia sp. H-1]
MALAVGLMALLLLTVVRGDLLASWKDTTPPDAPNHVILNIDPGQRAALDARLAPYGAPVLYPLIRARIVSIYSKVSDTHRHGSGTGQGHARARGRHEQRGRCAARKHADGGALVQRRTRCPGRTVGGGRRCFDWLGIKLGQHVVFDVAGTRVDAVVTSLRKVNWRSRQSNFIFLLSPGAARALLKPCWSPRSTSRRPEKPPSTAWRTTIRT